METFIFDEFRTELLPLMYVKIDFFFYLFSINCEILIHFIYALMYIRSRLHLILQDFSSYVLDLCKKCVFLQCLQNCLNLMKILCMLRYIYN